MQEANRVDTLYIGVWTGSNSSLRLFDTKSAHCNNYRDERKGHNRGNIGSNYGIRRRQNHNRFPSGGTKNKG
jgi:hypothetical protein